LRRKTHQTIAKITSDFEQLHLNTSVAALMELFNQLSEFNADPVKASDADVFVMREALEALVVMLTPFSPHIAEEMWEALGHARGLLGEAPRWPIADPELARRERLEIPVQVNGKLRSRVIAAPDVSEDDLRAAALADDRVKSLIDGHEVVKVVVVPRRLVNIVIKSA
jgi:leucyl-tRNA synthetase